MIAKIRYAMTRPWTHDDEGNLFSLVEAGCDWLSIAKTLNRSLPAVQTRFFLLERAQEPKSSEWIFRAFGCERRGNSQPGGRKPASFIGHIVGRRTKEARGQCATP